MKFYVVIPARYNSSRFPGKVLADIGSKTMLEHAFENAMKSKASGVFIATDNDKVFQVAQKFTKNVFMTSDSNINGTERIAELAKILEWPDETLVINLQADMPQLQYDNIDLLADKARDNLGLSTLYYDLQSSDLKKDRNAVKICINNSKISFYREVDKAVKGDIFRHIGIYAYYVRDLKAYKHLGQSSNEKNLSLEQYRFVDNGYKISAYLATSDPGVSIDSLDNLNQLKGINH
tara:strand:+ start:111 stop:815 length:705 start_codon:yes stop_codon:yes gene_type:complete